MAATPRATPPGRRGPYLQHSDKATWDEADWRVANFPGEENRADVSRYVDWKRGPRECSPGTVRTYLVVLAKAARDLKTPLLEAADNGSLERYLLKRATELRDKWQYLLVFRDYLAFHEKAHGYCVPPKGRPQTRATRRKGKKRRTFNVVSTAEFRKALRRCSGPMERALLYIMWDTGMRPGEALSLRYGDVERDAKGHFYVNLPEEEVSAFNLKTGDRRVVLVESVAALREWVESHPTQETPDTLWPRAGRMIPMTRKTLARLVAEWTPGHTPKDYRHTAATRATLAGWNEAMMRAYFGWEPDSTMPSQYADFTASDANQMRLRKAGLLVEEGEDALIVPIKCARCNVDNERDRAYCYACGGPLRADLVAALRDIQDRETRLLAFLEKHAEARPEKAAGIAIVVGRKAKKLAAERASLEASGE